MKNPDLVPDGSNNKIRLFLQGYLHACQVQEDMERNAITQLMAWSSTATPENLVSWLGGTAETLQQVIKEKKLTLESAKELKEIFRY